MTSLGQLLLECLSPRVLNRTRTLAREISWLDQRTRYFFIRVQDRQFFDSFDLLRDRP